jgi:hypothetical protein
VFWIQYKTILISHQVTVFYLFTHLKRHTVVILTLCLDEDDGVIGGLLTAAAFQETFDLSSSMEGTVTALFVIGCLLFALILLCLSLTSLI